MVPLTLPDGGVDDLRDAATALCRRLAPLWERLRPWLNRRTRDRYLRGDPDARREHLQVAGAAGAATMLGATLLGATPLVVSPVVWEGALWAWLALALLGVAANGYWRGGLATAYALAYAPVVGGALGATSVGAFTGVGIPQAAALVVGLVLVPLTDGVGHCARRTREGWL